MAACSWFHFQVKSHSIWYEPIQTWMKMMSLSSKLINPALMVNYFVMLFFRPIGLMMREQSSFECGACLLGFYFSTKDFFFWMDFSFASYSTLSGSRRLRKEKKYRIIEMVLATLKNVYWTHVNETALTQKSDRNWGFWLP